MSEGDGMKSKSREKVRARSDRGLQRYTCSWCDMSLHKVKKHGCGSISPSAFAMCDNQAYLNAPSPPKVKP